MRWPNRKPHVLTPGMRAAQHALARFLPLIDWMRFDRRCVTKALQVQRPGPRGLRDASHRQIVRFACASADQAVIYLLRADKMLKDGRVDVNAPGVPLVLTLPGLVAGRYTITMWNTRAGEPACPSIETAAGEDGRLRIELQAFSGDLACAVTRAEAAS
jgi:mannan endo-1,4-beta-mannosidase